MNPPLKRKKKMTAILKDEIMKMFTVPTKLYVIKPEMKKSIPMGIVKFLSMVREGIPTDTGVVLTTLPKTRDSAELADFASLLMTISVEMDQELTELGIVFHKGRYGAWKTFTVPAKLMVEYTG